MLISLPTLFAFIVEHALHDLDYLLALSKTKRLLPQAGAVVADDHDVVVLVLIFDVLPQLLQNKGDIFFIAGQKIPAGPRVKFFRKRFQLWRRVYIGIDADRNDARVFAKSIAQSFLNFFEIACD